MFWHIFKITLRNYRKNLLFTIIIVSGLAISMATIMVISQYMIQEYNTDKFHKEYPNIYSMMGISSEKNSFIVTEEWADKLKSGYPGIKDACRIDRIMLNVIKPSGAIRLRNVLSTDPSFFRIFSFPIMKGNAVNPLPDPRSVILSESTALRLFGNSDPIGKVIQTKIDNDVNFLTVTAVTKDPPENSRIQFEALVSFQCKSFHYHMMSFSSNIKGIYKVIYLCNTYLLAHEKADIPQMNTRLKKESYKESRDIGYFYHLSLQPYSEIYFDQNKTDSFKHGDKKMLFVLLSLAMVLILLACANYINLSTLKTFVRGKEIAYKKVSGASYRMLAFQFFTESTGLSVLAFFLAIILSKFMAGIFSEMVNSHVDVSLFLRFPQVIWVFLFAILLGMVSGLYPAMMMSRFKTADLFRNGGIAEKSNLMLPKILFVFQFTLAIILVITALFIGKQLKYISDKDLGFNKEQLLHISVPPDVTPDALKTELMKCPGVRNISSSYGIPGQIAFTEGNLAHICIDSSFLSTFGISLIQGRNFSAGDKNVCLVNETFMKEKQWNRFEGKMSGDYRIIGVTRDFHTSSLYDKIVPLEMDFNTSYISDMTVQMKSGSNAGSLDFIKSTWKTLVPTAPLEYFFYDDWFDNIYKKEEAFGSLMTVFTLIAILISCFGLFGLLTYSIDKRAREIGIRKINGAGIMEILVMINRDFLKRVLIAFLIASPVAYFLLTKWLQHFAYKAGLSWWIFVISGILALGIAVITVSWKSWFAAKRNPAEVIREQ